MLTPAHENPVSPVSSAPTGLESHAVDALRDDLQKQCHMWQRKLRLQDWNVHVSLARLSDMPGGDAIGAIVPRHERKDAQMTLLTPLDLPLVSAGFLQQEELNYDLTIVHELIHLHLWSFTLNLTEAQLVCEEQAVNALSRCIIAAHSHQSATQDTPLVEQTSGHYL